MYIYMYQEEPAHLKTPPATPWSSLSPKSLVHLHILAFAPQVQVAFNFTQLSRMGAVQSLEVDQNSSWMIQNLVAFMVDPKDDFIYFPSSSSSSSPPSSSSSQNGESDQMKTAQYENFSLPQNTESPQKLRFPTRRQETRRERGWLSGDNPTPTCLRKLITPHNTCLHVADRHQTGLHQTKQ